MHYERDNEETYVNANGGRDDAKFTLFSILKSFHTNIAFSYIKLQKTISFQYNIC